MRSAPDHNVIRRHLRRQAGNVGSRELAVAVAQHDPREGAGAYARDHCGAITAIGRMMYHFEARIGSGQTIGDFAGTVAAAVVDYDDFVALS